MRQRIIENRHCTKEIYDRKHYDGVRYEVGEIVVMQRQPFVDQNSKLQAKYREKPLQVMRTSLEKILNLSLRRAKLTNIRNRTV